MQTANILIVEDERIIALDLGNRLTSLGYTVIGTAASGKAALDAVLKYHPDIILMDVHLEDSMDGTQVAKLIHDGIGTPVIFLTAYAGDDTLARALDSLPFGYLVKPVDTRELHATLQTTLIRATTEQKLVQSEQRLQIALDAAGMGIWEWECKNNHFTTDVLFNSILGDVPDAMDETIEYFLNRLYLDDREFARQTLQRAINENSSVSASFRYTTTNGQIRWLEIHARVSHDPKGERLIGVVKDVTERHRMEDELRQSAAVFETISEGLFVLNQDGCFSSVNPAFLTMTGYSQDELLGTNPQEFLHARRHSDQFYQRLVTEKQGRWEGETWYRRRSGEVFPVWESMRAVLDANGKINHYVASIADITPLRRAEEKINHLAYHDPLTGLPNRMLFNDRLDRILALAHRKQKLVAIMFIDLDGFKSINDTLGHSSGDLLLQTVAARLQSTLRNSDIVARMGGDEFVVIIDDLERNDVATILAQKLLDALSQPMDLAGERVAIPGSIGIAIYPDDGADRQALMRAADTAMYNAKAHGKNQACFYTPQLAAEATERMNLEQGLRQALESQDFLLHYQPQFRLQDGAFIGVEALIRWQHPKRGLISPDVFIPIAEDSGLIGAIGAWVLRTACAEVGAWMTSENIAIRLAVNVSARQLRHANFLTSLQQILVETQFPANLLEIEITESTLQVLEDSRTILAQIRALGIGVAIDDFGTGYSSLSVLKHMHIDRLKIDRTFVRDVPHDVHDTGIVEAIVAMGRTLGLSLIAEGVERQEQLDFLRHLQCDEVQGYLLGRPVFLEDLKSHLQKYRIA